MSWVNDMMTIIEATELGKDLSGAESLLQSHKERKVYPAKTLTTYQHQHYAALF